MVSFSGGAFRTSRLVAKRRLQGLGALAAIAGAVADPDAAAWADVPQIGVTGTTVYDDNIYRLPAAIQHDLSHGGADIGNTVAVSGSYAANLDPALLTVQANVQKTFFIYNRQLNALEYDLTGVVAVKGGHGDASLSLGQARSASSFEDVKLGPRNIVTLTEAHFNSDIDVAGAIGVLVDVTATIDKNTNPFARSGDNRRVEASAGFGYNSRSLGNVLALQLDYISQHGLHAQTVVFDHAPTLFRADYTQRSAGLRLQWEPSVIWSVNGNAGYAQFQDMSGLAKNQSGFVGNLSVAWSPSPFLTATVLGARSFSGTEDIYSNGVKTVSLSANITAQPADGWNAGLGYSYRNRRFAYDFQATNPLALGRTERLSDLSASLSHSFPFRGTLSLEAHHRWRTSNLANYRYRETAFSLNLTVPITR